jgi:hypothetical protein
MKQEQSRVIKLARLLESATKKHNESAEAACSVAAFFDRDRELSDGMFDAVSQTVTELACVSLDKKPDYVRYARTLISKVAHMPAQKESEKITNRK